MNGQIARARGSLHSALGTRNFAFLPLAICIYFAILGILYARALPLFEATDEAAHFLYVHHLLETVQLPVLAGNIGDQGDAPPAERWQTERHQPPLYYLLGVLLVSWSQRDDIDDYLQTNLLIFMRNIPVRHVWLHNPGAPSGDSAAAVWTLRLFSIALATGTLVFVYRAGRLAFGRRVGLLAMALVASIPMVISLAGSVNNDNLVTLFYAAGVWWCLRVWQRRAITRLDMAVISLILSGAALSKLTGLTLFGVVYLALVMGGYRRWFPWRVVAATVLVTLVASAALSGWWYARNVQLYGDPFARGATVGFFGGHTPQRATLADIANEGARVWRTFWMGIGYLHALVYGPNWFYDYAGFASLAAFVGIGLLWWRAPAEREKIFFLAAVFAVMVAALVAGTRGLDISYGRILYPALAAIAPLMAAGWLALFGRLGGILVLPLAAMALIAPVTILPEAYPTLQAVESLPPPARPVDAHAESLTLVGYELARQTISPGEPLRLWLYVQGQHLDSPTLHISVIDPLTRADLGALDFYPGMSPASRFDPAVIYRVPVEVALDSTRLHSAQPRQLSLAVGWSVPFPARTLAWTGADMAPSESLLLAGPVWRDPAYAPPAPEYPADVVYGERIRLAGYSLSGSEVPAGASLTVTLHWAHVADVNEDWTVAVGLLDAGDHVLANADGMPPGYPTSAWQRGTAFTDARTMAIPADTPPGEYRLYVGWYRLSDGERLTPRGEGVEGSLFIAPTRITVR